MPGVKTEARLAQWKECEAKLTAEEERKRAEEDQSSPHEPSAGNAPLRRANARVARASAGCSPPCAPFRARRRLNRGAGGLAGPPRAPPSRGTSCAIGGGRIRPSLLVAQRLRQ
jgi:hypothetical protein